MRAVLFVALCATFVAGQLPPGFPTTLYPAFPPGASKAWSGIISTRFVDISGSSGCADAPVDIPATFTFSATEVKWSVPAFSQGNFSFDLMNEKQVVVSNDPVKGELIVESGRETYIKYSIVPVNFTIGQIPFPMAAVKLKYCTMDAEFPSEHQGSQTCEESQGYCIEATLYDPMAMPLGFPIPPESHVYCATYCDRVLSACTDANSVFASRSACLEACVQFPPTGAEPDMVSMTTGYNSLQCRTFQADLAMGMPAIACPATKPTSTVCILPSLPCNRLCDLTEGPLFKKRCSGEGSAVKPFTNYVDCMTKCGDYEINVPIAPGPMALGTNTWQCRITAAGALNQNYTAEMQPISSVLDVAYCGAFAPEGGAMCAGVDYVADWAGLYETVPGHCTPGNSLGQCCCNRGVANITRSFIPLPNLLNFKQQLSGGVPCAGLAELDVPIFLITSPTVASAAVQQLGVSIRLDLTLSKGNNELRFVNTLLPGCDNFACKDRDGECVAAKEVDFSAAPRAATASVLLAALLALTAAFLMA